MANPVLNEKAFRQSAGGSTATLPPPDARSANLAAEAKAGWAAPAPTADYVRGSGTETRTGVMTFGGTVTATGVLFTLLLVTGVVGWNAVTVDPLGNVRLPGWLFVAMIGAVICAMVAIFKPPMARFLAPVYALAEGLILGAISRLYEEQWQGIVLQAVGATLGVFAVTLVLYSLRIVKVTNRFRMIVMAATLGLAVFYLLSIVLSLFGANIAFINSPSGFGIAFSVLAAGIAAFNLFLDFDLVERGVQMQAPKYMEWYAGLGLMLTLVWLYLEMLRLLGKLRSN